MTQTVQAQRYEVMIARIPMSGIEGTLGLLQTVEVESREDAARKALDANQHAFMLHTATRVAVGDDVYIKARPSGEKFETTFHCYAGIDKIYTAQEVKEDIRRNWKAFAAAEYGKPWDEARDGTCLSVLFTDKASPENLKKAFDCVDECGKDALFISRPARSLSRGLGPFTKVHAEDNLVFDKNCRLIFPAPKAPAPKSAPAP